LECVPPLSSGLADGDDIQTMYDYYDVDEKRKP
jgi:hypothetical protein